MRTFWDGSALLFRGPVASAETVPSDGLQDRGYVVWPVVVCFRALAEAERSEPGRWERALRATFLSMERYYDAEAGAYNAWLTFPGNNDKYFDDNGWAVLGLLAAFEATRDRRFLERATEVFDRFLIGGIDRSGKPGGVRWGTDPDKPGTSDRNACSTEAVALAALGLAGQGHRRPECLALARGLLDWLEETLVDRDGLVRDGLFAPNWAINPTKWTYNTGNLIRAWVDWSALSGDRTGLERAERLAEAACDRTKPLYDSVVADPSRRHWFDSTFFAEHLADGLLRLERAVGGSARRAEVERHAEFALRFLKDTDGLYWRNLRPWRIAEGPHRAWRRATGASQELDPDEAERSKAPEALELPVGRRPLVKTLLGNAGMANLLWHLARTDGRN